MLIDDSDIESNNPELSIDRWQRAPGDRPVIYHRIHWRLDFTSRVYNRIKQKSLPKYLPQSLLKHFSAP